MSEFIKNINKIRKDIFDNFQDIIYFKEPLYSLTAFIELYIFLTISKFINDRIIILIICNIIIFYDIIEKKYPKFLFKSRMYIKEIIEGILGIIIALIPKYEEVRNEK